MVLFPTPFHAMWNVVIQTADGPDAEPFEATLAHRAMVYTLFLVFIVAGPLLFNNFLVGPCMVQMHFANAYSLIPRPSVGGVLLCPPRAWV